MTSVGSELSKVDDRVALLRKTFEETTKDAARLKIDLEKAEETMSSAQNLVGKLDNEHHRWDRQVNELQKQLDQLPKLSLLSASFVTYLSSKSEDERSDFLKKWLKILQLEKFDLKKFLCTESELLMWKSEGLPSDELSVENSIVILESLDSVMLFDPSNRAIDWLKKHMSNQKMEAINQQDANFTTQLELAVRFGKTLIIQEADGIDPVLYPLMRKDLQSQGPRYVIQIGEKTVDYNNDFKLFITSRNSNPYLPPDAVAITTMVNFTTTRAGLSGQLLAATIQNEKPELESKKTELLKTEEDYKIQLSRLEDTLLEELASAKGNILENKELLESLNKTKESSAVIEVSLEESLKLTESLDKERQVFSPLAETGSKLYFVITRLESLNNMYKFSLNAYLGIFEKALKKAEKALKSEKYDNPEDKIVGLKQILIALVYNYVSRSLFKDDRMMFAMHVVNSMFSKQFKENEWAHFTKTLISDVKGGGDRKSQVPSWLDNEQASGYLDLKNNLPDLFQKAGLADEKSWRDWCEINDCEKNFQSDKRLTLFQQILIIQALRPDRLQIAMKDFACRILNLKDISPSTSNIKFVYETETVAHEPILIIISPGSDPSDELREVAESVVGKNSYHEVNILILF
jgi:dynein heavy chain 2, cytosolic